jgi:acetylornithine deacetylase/succinyl-diaminopimelate desuccinylase-like protein
MIDRLLTLADGARDEIAGLARDLVRLETVNTGVMPTGGETEAAEFLRAFLRRHGIHDVALFARDPARANLVARLPGRAPRSRLLLLGHSDVVPAGDRQQWQHEPFGGEISEGRLYGRGAADMKGTVAAEVMALVLLRRAAVELRHSVTLACVADEEAGGGYGMGWLAREHPDPLRCDLVLNEGGGQFAELGGRLCCLMALGEKGRHEAAFELGGRGAHAAQPWWGENAFYLLGRLLGRLESYAPERRVELPLFAAIHEQLALPQFQDQGVNPGNVDEFAAALAELHPALGSACRALSRLTIVPSLVRGGQKSNSVPDQAQLRCDVRSLPSQDRDYVLAELRQLAAGLPQAVIHLETTANASQSPLVPEVIAGLKRAMHAATGREVTLLPGLTAGFTDSRFARDLGLLAYGLTPGDPGSSRSARNAHGPDEWTSVDDLVTATKFFLASALELDSDQALPPAQ